jgi:hypothetical protein
VSGAVQEAVREDLVTDFGRAEVRCSCGSRYMASLQNLVDFS